MPTFDWARWSIAMADAAVDSLVTPAALESRRHERLQRLVEAACGAHWFASRLRPRPAGGWRLQDLPRTRKPALMARFDDWVTDPAVSLPALREFTADPTRIGTLFLDRYAVWQSSGSSGEPGMFVSDGNALAVYDALELSRRTTLRHAARLFDPWMVGERIAFVGAIDGHFASIAAFERLRRLNAWLKPRMAAFSLLQPVDALCASIQDFSPTLLCTYPSCAAILAEQAGHGHLRLAVREIWTGGEPLTPAMRVFVSNAFGCPVSNEYGASEFLPLAMECAFGRLHLNADWAILESVDARGHPARHGDRGSRCLLTNLANHVQPIIRYELGDRVLVSTERCRCGSHLPIVDVLGRDDDLLHVGRGAASVTLSPLALTTVLEEQAGLFAFQLVQRGPQLLELNAPVASRHDAERLDRGRDALLDFLQRQGASGVRVDCRIAEPRRDRSSGKVKRVLAAPLPPGRPSRRGSRRASG